MSFRLRIRIRSLYLYQYQYQYFVTVVFCDSTIPLRGAANICQHASDSVYDLGKTFFDELDPFLDDCFSGPNKPTINHEKTNKPNKRNKKHAKTQQEKTRAKQHPASQPFLNESDDAPATTHRNILCEPTWFEFDVWSHLCVCH